MNITIRHTIQFILAGKLYHFVRRSFPRYVLASVLFGLALSQQYSFFKITGIVCVACIMLSFIVMLLSTVIMQKQLQASDYIFHCTASHIQIEYLNDSEIEQKEWTWIQRVAELNSFFVLQCKNKPKRIGKATTQIGGYTLFISKTKITADQASELRGYLQDHGVLAV